jgi:hypothetical protein
MPSFERKRKRVGEWRGRMKEERGGTELERRSVGRGWKVRRESTIGERRG